MRFKLDITANPVQGDATPWKSVFLLFPKQIENQIVWLANEISTFLQVKTNENILLQQEINIQLKLNRQVFIIWFSLITQVKEVAKVALYIENPANYNPLDVSKAYELLDHLCTTASLRQAINLISKTYIKNLKIQENLKINPDLYLLATHHFQCKQGILMNNFDKVTFLRGVKLFEQIPLESLRVIADVANEMNMIKGQIIFKDKDESDKFYCIVSGEVRIEKRGKKISSLKENDYFGELGLLDNMPRSADVIAETDGVLLCIDKEEFMRILEDLPKIMIAVASQIIQYLRHNLELKM